MNACLFLRLRRLRRELEHAHAAVERGVVRIVAPVLCDRTLPADYRIQPRTVIRGTFT